MKRIAAWSISLAFLLLALSPPVAMAEDSSITINASLSSDFVLSVSGRLQAASGTPIGGAPLTVSISDIEVANVTTSNNGEFGFAVPVPAQLQQGRQRLTIRFAGQGDYAPTVAAAILAFSEPESSAPPPPTEPQATPTPAAVPVVIEASISPLTVSPGDLLQIQGTVKTADGKPVRGTDVQVFFDDVPQPDSTVVTNDKGNFTTYAQAPEDIQPGKTKIVLTSTGSSPGTLTKTLTVTESEAVDETDAAPTPSPAEAEPTTPQPTQAPAADSDEKPVSTPVTATVDGMPKTDPMSWFFVTLTIAGGLAVVVTLSLAIYGLRHAQRKWQQDRLFGDD